MVHSPLGTQQHAETTAQRVNEYAGVTPRARRTMVNMHPAMKTHVDLYSWKVVGAGAARRTALVLMKSGYVPAVHVRRGAGVWGGVVVT